MPRLCSVCGISSECAIFNKCAKNKDGLYHQCQECYRKWRRNYRVKNRGEIRIKDDVYRLKNLEKISIKNRTSGHNGDYKITKEQYLELIAYQNNKCCICGVEFSYNNGRERTPCVDHCHKNKNIRGLLCLHCNLFIGLAKDKIETLRAAKIYIEYHDKRNELI